MQRISYGLDIRKKCVDMVVIDLLAVFDTITNSILLHRLSECYMGSKEMHNVWLKSYLTDRRQSITITGERSEEQAKYCDVPQGSVLVPNLSEDYTASSLGDIFCKHGVLFHTYADDTKIYLPFSPGEEGMAITQIEQWLREVCQWMATNWLHLNESNIEFIIFG